VGHRSILPSGGCSALDKADAAWQRVGGGELALVSRICCPCACLAQMCVSFSRGLIPRRGKSWYRLGIEFVVEVLIGFVNGNAPDKATDWLTSGGRSIRAQTIS
jgi:hypothetical protein